MAILLRSIKKSRKINPQRFPPSLTPIIIESMELSQQSNHYYNPSIGKLINLWQFHRYQKSDIKPPADKDIQSLIAQKPRMSNLSINSDNQLISSNPAVSLNFGAFAKGYAIALALKNYKH